MFIDPSPKIGDSNNNLLYKIAQILNSGGVAGGSVSSFNARTGAVSLTLSDVSTVADSRYVMKVGDTMTGALVFNRTIVSDVPIIQDNTVWNNAGVTFTAVKLNITNTASGSNSNLIDFQVDGFSVLNLTRIGVMRILRQNEATESGVNLVFRKRGNSGSSSGEILNGAGLGTIQYSGWNGASFVTAASVICSAEEDFTGLANGSLVKVQVTPTGTASSIDAMVIRGSVAEFNIPLGRGGANLLSFGSSTTLSFFAATPVVKQTSGANLTNSVTAGGTDDTIANFTDLTTYANDSAAIRNNIYQLARKLKQINDGLRAYGLFT